MRRSRSGSEEEGDRGKTSRRATQPSNNNSRRSLSPDGSPPPKTNKHRGHHPKSSSKAPRSLSPMERRKEQKPRRSSLARLTLTAPSGHDDESFGATASSSMFPERTTVKKPNRRIMLESQSDEDGLMRTLKMNHKPHATLSADAAIEGVRRSDKPRRRTKRGSGRDVVGVTKAKRSSSKRSQPVKALSASSGLDFRQDWEKEVSLESTKKASLSDSDPLVLNWEGSDDESDGNEGIQDCQLRDSLDATDADDAV
eukprot:Sro90_g047390.2  (255) ;mRNA; f:71123-71887